MSYKFIQYQGRVYQVVTIMGIPPENSYIEHNVDREIEEKDRKYAELQKEHDFLKECVDASVKDTKYFEAELQKAKDLYKQVSDQRLRVFEQKNELEKSLREKTEENTKRVKIQADLYETLNARDRQIEVLRSALTDCISGFKYLKQSPYAEPENLQGLGIDRCLGYESLLSEEALKGAPEKCEHDKSEYWLEKGEFVSALSRSKSEYEKCPLCPVLSKENPLYKCQSYFEDGKVFNCNCGRCAGLKDISEFYENPNPSEKCRHAHKIYWLDDKGHRVANRSDLDSCPTCPAPSHSDFCPKCNGKGYLSFGPHFCSDCNGTGKIPIPSEESGK